MQAEPSAISRNTAGSPPSRTRCQVAVTTDSVTEARTSTGASTIPSIPMRVWIDLTNSPHVLVMRPVIEALERDGHEVRVTARDFAQTLGLLRRFEIPHTAIGRHRGERLAAKAGGLALRSGALVRWARAEARGSRAQPPSPSSSPLRPLLRHRARPWLQRRERRRRAAADSQRHDVRLRVGDRAAPDQLPPGARGGRARGDPARAPRPLRRARQGARLRGVEGGVLPRRLRARPRDPRPAGARPRAADRRGAHSPGGLALPPLRERPLRAGAGASARRGGQAAGRGCSRWCCPAPRPSARSSPACPASSSPSRQSTRSR